MTSEPSVTREEIERLANRAEIVNIVAQECHAVRHTGEAPQKGNVMLEMAMAPEAERVNYKFDLTCSLADESDSAVADVRVVIIAHYSVSPGPAVTEPVFNAFGSDVALRNAFPFLRQNVHDLGSRIGLYGLILGLLRPGAQGPVSVSLNRNILP